MMKPNRPSKNFTVLRNIDYTKLPSNEPVPEDSDCSDSVPDLQTSFTDKHGCHDGIDKNQLDLYLPDVDGKRISPASLRKPDCCAKPPPLVIFVHGGGWRRGGRQQWRHYLSSYDTNLLLSSIFFCFNNLYQNIGESFAQNGIACAVISYPLLKPTLWVTLFEIFTSFCQSTLLSTVLLAVAMLLFTWCLPFTNIYGLNQIYLHIMSMIDNDLLQRANVIPLCLMLSQLLIWLIICLNIRNYGKGLSKYILFSIPTAVITFIIYFYYSQPTISTSLWVISCTCTVSLQTTIAINQVMFVYKSDNTKCIDQVRSVAKSFRWLMLFGKETSLYDTDKIVLAGHSAGSHLINLLVWDEQCLEDHELDRKDVKGIISLSGVHNLCNLNFSPVRHLYLASFGDDLKALEQLSPLNHITKYQAVEGPQFLIISAEHDYDFFKDDAKEYVDKLKSYGHAADYEIIPEATHLSLPWAFEAGKDTTLLEQMCFHFVKQL